MKKLILLFIIANFGFFMFAQEKPTYKAYWSNGMKVESSDGAFKFKFGGRVQNDWAAFFEDDGIKDSIGASANGTEFRRARLFSSGQIYHNVKYKLQLDFGGGAVKLKDAYIMITKIPVIGFIQIGHFKEPMGFEEITSSKYITFMERSLTAENVPSRNTGFLIGNSTSGERLSFNLGVFKDADSYGNVKGLQDKYNVTARVYGLPVYDADNNKILHLGAAYSYRNQQNNEYEFESGPEAHLANDYLSTGTVTDAKTLQLIQAEAVFISGSLSLKSEMVHSRVDIGDSPSRIDFNHTAFSGMASYFLTGESKKYATSGEFSRVKPKRNFDGQGGVGAWEVALRYSAMNLNSTVVRGGELGNITFGLNWYLNPATRIMTNYIYSNLKGVGKANIVQMRFQVDF